MTDQVISTKLNWGNDYSDMKVNNNGLSRKHIVEGMNGSLKRLQLDYGQQFRKGLSTVMN